MGCLLFSSLVPLVPFYAFLFFLIKFQVDKYNLVFRYYHQSESGGLMRSIVIKYILIYIFTYMLLLTLFFYLNYDGIYCIFGFISIVIWFLVIVFFRKCIEPS